MILVIKKCFIVTVIILFFVQAGFCKTSDEQQDAINKIKYMNYNYSEYGFNIAIKKGRKDVVELFLDSGMSANTTVTGQPMTFSAILFSQNDILDFLLTKGADINAIYNSYNLLTFAIYRGNVGAIDVLIKHNFDINKPNSSVLPIDYAISINDAGVVSKLLSGGAVVNKETYKRSQNSSNPLIKNSVKDAYYKNSD